jgi:hypothetical protein
MKFSLPSPLSARKARISTFCLINFPGAKSALRDSPTNNNQNTQGTGTTIIKVAPNGQTSLFFQGTAPLGLSTGLAVLKAGFVLVANCPTTGGATPMAMPGSLLLIDRHGHLVSTIISPVIQGPWDFTVQDDENSI